jgi:hypothetical protein
MKMRRLKGGYAAAYNTSGIQDELGLVLVKLPAAVG